MAKPLLLHELNKLLHEQVQSEQTEITSRIIQEEQMSKKALDVKNQYVEGYYNRIMDNINNRAKFLENAKIGLVSSALYKIYKESFGNEKLSPHDINIMKSMVQQFITEQGAGDVLLKWKHKNLILAELAKVCTDAYNNIVTSITEEADGSNKEDRDILKINKTDTDKFYDDLAMVDTQQASDLIHQRTQSAIDDFLDQNAKIRSDCEDIINNSNAKMASAKNDDSKMAIQTESVRRVKELKTFRKNTNPFHHLVEAIVKETFKDPALKNKYVHEASVDMDGIVHNAKLIYHFLETVNTLEIVDKDYISNYLMSVLD